jgi:hypothetical protein
LEREGRAGKAQSSLSLSPSSFPLPLPFFPIASSLVFLPHVSPSYRLLSLSLSLSFTHTHSHTHSSGLEGPPKDVGQLISQLALLVHTVFSHVVRSVDGCVDTCGGRPQLERKRCEEVQRYSLLQDTRGDLWMWDSSSFPPCLSLDPPLPDTLLPTLALLSSPHSPFPFLPHTIRRT